MNISQPVSSAIDRVDFTFLTSKEIHSMSVKKVEFDITFDSLLNPTRGGLYDPALGAWGESVCTTCNLGIGLCPGHTGHIDLPVPIFHPIFMDQALRLLKGQCVYCHRFRLRQRDLHRYECMLQLVQYGLTTEAHMLDAIVEDDLHGLQLPGVPVSKDVGDNDEFADGVMRARDAYVERVIKGLTDPKGELKKRKNEGANSARTTLIAQFFKDLAVRSPCGTCRGISPKYRKDRNVKIFEKALTSKEQGQMNAAGLARHQRIAAPNKTKKRTRMQNGYVSDEGVADLSSSDDEAGLKGFAAEGEGDELDENGDVIMGEDNDETGKERGEAQQVYLTPLEVRGRLELLFEKQQRLLNLIYFRQPRGKHAKSLNADMFFVDTILVPPNRFRPEARQGEGQVREAAQNNLYKGILTRSANTATIYREITEQAAGRGGLEEGRRRRTMTSLYEAWAQLQEAFNALVDKDQNPVRGAAGLRNEEGIKQKLEKKEGLFRKNMMGKRVNFAARTVISPDPNLETNEIGVPPVFARKLTFIEPVTSHNFSEMQQAVKNGMTAWPGAAAVETENGQVINLSNKSAEDRLALANQLLAPSNPNASTLRNKKVHRHLANGDVVIMNRQPTLHKPSMMGHRVRVLPGEKTLRMHYANCNSYNADFDGDEMNMHFPQNEIARAEALQLADTDHQYISYTAGKPLRGLIQDHLSVSVALCNRDTMFDQGAYHQLIYAALRPENGHILEDRLEVVPPAIMKPSPRWTGKQVFTTILKNIKPPGYGPLWMVGKTQVPANRWGPGSEEGAVLFQDGEFITGILDKPHLGPGAAGFVHSVHELYGPAIAGKLLSSIGRLLTRFLAMRAFTCGMDDLAFTKEGEKWRKRELGGADTLGLNAAMKYVSLENRTPDQNDPDLLIRMEEVLRDDSKQHGLDLVMNGSSKDLSGAVTKACLPAALAKQFPKNHMQSMTISGAKGSSVNANLISCNLGQQVLEGRRVPVMVSGKSLPCFRPYDTNIRAGGYIVDRFLTGIRPQEYYFHHMAGREGLIDTAVKTSRSGYLQRCLIKGMEGLSINYDQTVRDADGSLIQFLYGEDGVDVARQKFLTNFDFLLHNWESQVRQTDLGELAKFGVFDRKDEFLKQNKWALKHVKHNVPLAEEPVNAAVNPVMNAYATSEKFYGKLADYIKTNKSGLIREKKKGTGEEEKRVPDVGKHPRPRKQVEQVFAAKYLRALADPGDAVGITAGQSVGEPSTQMTLNTFHLAGHSAKNVTLGIPRLREILMTASAKIALPAMTLILNEELSEQDGRNFAKAISALPLSHVVDEVTVSEKIGRGRLNPLSRTYQVKLKFFPSKEYIEEYNISIADLLRTVEQKMLDSLLKLIKAEIKKARNNTAAAPIVGEKAGNVETAATAAERDDEGAGTAALVEDDDDTRSDADEDDAGGAKQSGNRTEAVSYGPNDDDDDEIQDRLRRESEPNYDEQEDEGFEGSPLPEDRKLQSDDDEDDFDAAEKLKVSSEARESRVLNIYDKVAAFRADESKGEWCDFTVELEANTPKMLMLNLVETAVKKSLIQKIAGIGECTFVPGDSIPNRRTGDTDKLNVVHTAGANLQAMQQYGAYIDPNRIITNDIYAVLDIYGVEACRTNIIRELGDVFEGHGISVDNRHLNLIADYMTRAGGFSPFSRIGLRGNVSPFTKMSFETTLAYLKDAILDGDWDDLGTPSARIVMGRIGPVGTGAFDVLTHAPTSHYDPMTAAEQEEKEEIKEVDGQPQWGGSW